MNRLRGWIARNELKIALWMMFLLTWSIELGYASRLPIRIPFPVYLLVGYGFGFSAILITGITQGKKAIIALLRRFLIWRVGWKWYLAALAIYPMVFLAAALLNSLITNQPLDFSQVFARQILPAKANLAALVLPFFFFDALTNGEEIGWRGYVLPRLQARRGALAASLSIGLIWGFWHLPKYLDASFQVFALFMVKTMIDSVLYTWLYNNTGGSLLLTTLLHAAGNTAGVFLPVRFAGPGGDVNLLVLLVALELVAALGVIAATGSQRLSRKAAKQVHPGRPVAA